MRRCDASQNMYGTNDQPRQLDGVKEVDSDAQGKKIIKIKQPQPRLFWVTGVQYRYLDFPQQTLAGPPLTLPEDPESIHFFIDKPRPEHQGAASDDRTPDPATSAEIPAVRYRSNIIERETSKH